MTIKNGDKPAMPIEINGYGQYAPEVYTGLTKREQFAAMMMQGFKCGDYYTFNDMASDAVAMADALLDQLEEKGDE